MNPSEAAILYGIATAGHNQPPSQIEELGQRHAHLLERKDELLEAAIRAPESCDDDETAGKLTDFAAQLGACAKEARESHKTEKQPFLDGGRTVDSFFKEIADPLEQNKKAIETIIGGYQFRKQQEAKRAAAEAERLAREEAERLAAEATTEAQIDQAIAVEAKANEQAAVVTARPVEISRVRGNLGSIGSLRTDYDYEVADMAQVPRQFLMLNDSAIKAHIKARPKDQAPADVAGLRFFPKHTSRVRA